MRQQRPDDDRPCSAPTVPPWAGWLRSPGQAWRQVCEGDDYGGCYSALLALTAAKHTDKLVLRRGEHPTDRPNTRRRHR